MSSNTRQFSSRQVLWTIAGLGALLVIALVLVTLYGSFIKTQADDPEYHEFGVRYLMTGTRSPGTYNLRVTLQNAAGETSVKTSSPIELYTPDSPASPVVTPILIP